MAIEPLTIKAQTVMKKVSQADAERVELEPGMVAFTNLEDLTGVGRVDYSDKMLFMSSQHWADLASPETITCTIVPGDQLNNDRPNRCHVRAQDGAAISQCRFDAGHEGKHKPLMDDDNEEISNG